MRLPTYPSPSSEGSSAKVGQSLKGRRRTRAHDTPPPRGGRYGVEIAPVFRLRSGVCGTKSPLPLGEGAGGGVVRTRFAEERSSEGEVAERSGGACPERSRRDGGVHPPRLPFVRRPEQDMEYFLPRLFSPFPRIAFFQRFCGVRAFQGHTKRKKKRVGRPVCLIQYKAGKTAENCGKTAAAAEKNLNIRSKTKEPQARSRLRPIAGPRPPRPPRPSPSVRACRSCRGLSWAAFRECG